MSMVRGFLTAFWMASLVISWKTILLVLAGSRPKVSQRCQEMASPSRSSSEASHTADDSAAALRSSATTRRLSAGTTYSGSNPLSTLTLSFLSWRSRMWPKLALTVKSFPKYFWNVLAFAGDSTITKFSITCLSKSKLTAKKITNWVIFQILMRNFVGIVL